MKRLFSLFFVLALVLSACGEASDTVDTTPAAANAGDIGTGSTDDTTTTTTSGEATLAEYLPFLSGPEDPAEAEAYYRDQERRAQEVTATCMAEEGFDYIPFVYEESFSDPFFDADATEEERRTEQGFGMAYWLLFEEDFNDFPYDEDTNPDPNWEIAEAMSEAEREAYYYALHGEQPDESAYEDFDWENATEDERMAFEEEMSRMWDEREWKGCYEAGYEDVFGGQDVWGSFEQEFGNMWEDIDLRVQADPRIIEFQQNWASCMSDAGFTFADQEDMWMTLDAEFTAIVDWGDGGGFTEPDIMPIMDDDGMPVENEDGSYTFVDSEGNIYTQQEVDDYYDELYGPTYDEAELTEFMDREISVAVADWECGGDVWELQGEIFEEYQNEWVKENKDALDAWKAAREAQG